MITLSSSTGETFEVNKEVAFKSETIKNLYTDCTGGTTVPVLQVTGPILAKVIQYCKKHVEVQVVDGVAILMDGVEELEEWDSNFIEGLNNAQLFDIVAAADYLCIQELLNFTCDHIAQTIHNFTPEEVRTYYNTR